MNRRVTVVHQFRPHPMVAHAARRWVVGHAGRVATRLGSERDRTTGPTAPRCESDVHGAFEPADGVGRHDDVVVDEEHAVGAALQGLADSDVHAAGEAEIARVLSR